MVRVMDGPHSRAAKRVLFGAGKKDALNPGGTVWFPLPKAEAGPCSG